MNDLKKRRIRYIRPCIEVTVIILVLAHLSFASPLLFKALKTINSKEFVELGSFDATRFREIRFGVKITSSSTKLPISKEIAEVELNSAKREIARNSRLLDNGDISKQQYDLSKERLNRAQEVFDNADTIVNSQIEIIGLEGDEEIVLATYSERNLNTSIVIETPPSMIKIRVKGQATFSVYVWGQM